MRSRWSENAALEAEAAWGEDGAARDLAHLVYATRLLGADPGLVLHGGGNSSVKTTAVDLTGERIEALHIKGSGWDMARIEPAGLPAVRLAPLRRLRALEALGDREMVSFQRGNLLDSNAPDPSIETLLHAFLPHRYVFHTHADAVLALTDQPDGATLCAEAFGRRAGVVPYVMPGFALAKACAAAHDADPSVEGLILLKHGVFSFGDSAREAYERMIALVSLAEDRLAHARPPRPAAGPRGGPPLPASEIAPILRGLLCGSGRAPGRMAAAFRAGPEVMDYLGLPGLRRVAFAGPATPDHVIRTRPRPLIVEGGGGAAAFRDRARRALDAHVAGYEAWFARNDARPGGPRARLDPCPRVVLVPGVGLFAFGRSVRAAVVCADIAETTARVAAAAEAVGRFESISEADVFDVEYWPLEQAKLGKASARRLDGHIVAVTGGGSGLGRATAEAFAREGAAVAVLDRDAGAAAEAAEAAGGLAFACDVTDSASVRAAFADLARSFGGLDILVSNAGAAWQGRIGDVAESVLHESFALNFYGHQRAAQAALAVMRAQGIGGVLLFNASKQAVNPGRDFGPYGLPKAALLALMRQYALDHGAEGIRANAVNADRIRSGLLTEAMIAARAAARGVSADAYMAGNLLGREVTAEDAARAFVDLALAEKTTGAVMTVDGGNVAAALR